MSRQKGAFGNATFVWNLKQRARGKSPTAGKNKYPTPHSSEREVERRLLQIDNGQIGPVYDPPKKKEAEGEV